MEEYNGLNLDQKFNDVPNIPDFPPNKGSEVIEGKVLHSMDYSAMDDASAANLIEGKTDTVVGILKSALDIANSGGSVVYYWLVWSWDQVVVG
ncbi:hypothetical protein IFM89_010112 [Coptis chinensis]|uniref:Uncharacterized protein n=1 Tax=Coptis chinensis TaxID=261450 RepID=A0A835I205_9MAGN|nr:hypothetical protein IFM89_010112 [Coptis chinensis]